MRAQAAFAREPAASRHSLGRLVLGTTSQLKSSQAQILEGPAGDQPHRMRRDAAPARLREELVSDRRSSLRQVDVVQRASAQQVVLVAGDDEREGRMLATQPYVFSSSSERYASASV